MCATRVVFQSIQICSRLHRWKGSVALCGETDNRHYHVVAHVESIQQDGYSRLTVCKLVTVHQRDGYSLLSFPTIPQVSDLGSSCLRYPIQNSFGMPSSIVMMTCNIQWVSLVCQTCWGSWRSRLCIMQIGINLGTICVVGLTSNNSCDSFGITMYSARCSGSRS